MIKHMKHGFLYKHNKFRDVAIFPVGIINKKSKITVSFLWFNTNYTRITGDAIPLNLRGEITLTRKDLKNWSIYDPEEDKKYYVENYT